MAASCEVEVISPMRRLRPALLACFGMVLVSGAPAEDWPQFRGPNRDGVSRETGLLRKWPEGGPRVLWTTEVCEGYAAASVFAGRVYVNDYNPDTQEWLVRCLTLDEGKELWRFAEKKPGRGIRRNHGITRTVPAVDGAYVCSLDPKCVFHCLDAGTGKELWQKNLVREYGATIPPWYNGQNPLNDGERVVLGIGGDDALMIAFEKSSGKEIWRTPNPNKWPLSHSSVMPAELCGVRQYVWCTLFGPLGVRAEDGALLWHHDRQFSTAVSPSPLPVGGDRVFMTGPYEAGSVMIRIRKDGETFSTETVFDWKENEWNSEIHTPILWNDHMFAVGKKKRGLLTCMDLDGNIVWTSQQEATFDMGGYLLADGLIYALDGKSGLLRLIEASTSEYRELDSAQLLGGHDVWGPPALSDGKLIIRDMTKMVCVEVGPSGTAGADNNDTGRSISAAPP